jgi:hypothetical protein
MSVFRIGCSTSLLALAATAAFGQSDLFCNAQGQVSVPNQIQAISSPVFGIYASLPSSFTYGALATSECLAVQVGVWTQINCFVFGGTEASSYARVEFTVNTPSTYRWWVNTRYHGPSILNELDVTSNLPGFLNIGGGLGTYPPELIDREWVGFLDRGTYSVEMVGFLLGGGSTASDAATNGATFGFAPLVVPEPASLLPLLGGVLMLCRHPRRTTSRFSIRRSV